MTARRVFETADLTAALRDCDDFVVYAPLGWRGQVRGLVRGIADGMGKRVQVSMPWYGLVEPREGESYGDYFYVLVNE